MAVPISAKSSESFRNEKSHGKNENLFDVLAENRHNRWFQTREMVRQFNKKIIIRVHNML
jgi:hypothetical protein